MPERENSVNWDTTQNVFIEGDNLEVLKVLQKHYYGKIKMIYIDPPYNTGNDFVYSDDFRDGVNAYLEWTKQVNELGKVTSNSETTGRYHTNWLNMMYPRLKLARNLLSTDGLMLISIGDVEFGNLRQICNEIFGEQNLIGVFSRTSAEGGGLAKQMIKGHDYVVAYARSIGNFPPLLRPKEIRGKIVEIEGEDYWIEEDWLRKEFGKYGTCLYEQILDYYSQDKLDEINKGLEEGIYTLLKKSKKGHVVGRYRKISEDGSKFYSVIKHLNSDGVRDLESLGNFDTYFDFPKPVSLLHELIRGATFTSHNDERIILDFFAGSGTTAEAVVRLNAEDGGNRRSISVQLPEPTLEGSDAHKAGFKTISDISRERIRRAGTKILKDEAEKLTERAKHLDVGFRSYRLADTNFAKWRVNADLDEDKLEDLFNSARDSADNTASPEDLFIETSLKLGLSLTERYQEQNIAGLSVFNIDDGLVIGYFDEHVKPTLEQLRELVEIAEVRFIVLEDAFQGDDELKTNLVQLCKTRGIDLSIA
ncbi:site-specific DNA-methyltransferase [Corynebacterium ulcerans]|uniref:site-specific DNA-methyltransferase n=1 Tax=Corynebacterium ulcerans TaxID=65058 RepID=UPI000CACFF87|nr:site-specific DNA-methyltransferase [Corynebacterium ulcerans]PLW00825.1 site-specific DNA-methyltransferase [Corynebacterium ulcerans]